MTNDSWTLKEDLEEGCGTEAGAGRSQLRENQRGGRSGPGREMGPCSVRRPGRGTRWQGRRSWTSQREERAISGMRSHWGPGKQGGNGI